MYRDAITLAGGFCKMCLLKYRPQDVPASRELLLLCIALYFLLKVLLLILGGYQTNTLPIALIDTVYALVFVFLLLLLCRKVNRWMQTMTATAGTGIIFGLLHLPAVIVLPDSGAMTAVQQILSLAFYLVLIWYVVVQAHIFRHAMSSSFALGVFVSIICLLAGVLIELVLVFLDS